MESTCFKTLKLQNCKIFVKCLVKVVKQGPFYDVVFQSFDSNITRSNIMRPNNNQNFRTSSGLHFEEIKSKSLVNYSKF